MPINDDIPGTLERSPKKAQATYSDTLNSAEETYDHDEARAHRTAWAAVKHSFEKVGDHWEPKDEKGPSDKHSEGGVDDPNPTAGGIDVKGHSKEELMDRAKKLDITGRSKMTKEELGRAIAKAQD